MGTHRHAGLRQRRSAILAATAVAVAVVVAVVLTRPEPAPRSAPQAVATASTPTAAAVTSSSTSPSPSPSPSASPSASPRRSLTAAATGWPAPRGTVPLSDGTIEVSGVFDGGMKRYCCIGDGGQSESQDPVFVLAPGATLKNVVIGAPGGDGVHCAGDCTLVNVWWEDVGEDAATFRGGTHYTVTGGGARSASDKVFQHNGPGTVTITGFLAENIGKLYRACGNCSTSYTRHVVLDGVRVKNAKVLAGINVNWGDTARFRNITVVGDAGHDTVICDKYEGAPKGDEPEHVGSGADGVNCLYSSSDVTWR